VRRLLPGTLDMLVLKCLDVGALHGYGIMGWIRQASGGTCVVGAGALWEALDRLEQKGCIVGQWGRTAKNRRARYYSLAPSGAEALKRAIGQWRKSSAAMDRVLEAG
jgi:PadR family transcriptional regulator, regulatory protein PadR